MTFKFGNSLPAGHPVNQGLAKASERIAALTNGIVKIRIFPNNQLGSDTDMLSQVRSGALEMLSTSGISLAAFVPVAAIGATGFAFSGYERIWPAMDGALGAYVRDEIAKVGVTPMRRMWDNGIKHITTRGRPVHEPKDLEGLKLRVVVSPITTSLFQSLGAAPLAINFGEVYSALQTGIADGQDNPLATIEISKFYEVQKYLAITAHNWDGFWLIANRRFWDRLPSDVRAIVGDELDKSALEQRQALQSIAVSLEATLSDRGMIVTRPERAAFENKLRHSDYYSGWRDRFGATAWRILESAAGVDL